MSASALRVSTIVTVALLFAVPPTVGPDHHVSGLGIVPFHSQLPSPGSLPKRAFAFVSNFEDQKLDGWRVVNGTASVVATPNYQGEPFLQSSGNGSSPQYDQARAGFVRDDRSLSFGVTIRASGGTGYFGLESRSGPVATVGIRNLSIVAGATPATVTTIGSMPRTTSQPTGWVLLIGYVFRTGSGATASYAMEVYADRTDIPLATRVPVPNAHSYSGAFIETTHGTVDYTNIVVSSYRIGETISGFNPMEGYGQGSGSLVQLLPAFASLSATETLGNWSVPERAVLSFQINAMNYTGTVRSTCSGFFQLGVDLEPKGRIAPWYVPGRSCAPKYFGHPPSWGGFSSPSGTVLHLAILANLSTHLLDFTLVDTSITGANRTWTSTMAYNGTLFFGSYTQLEFQPTSKYPISQYFLNGSLDGLRISGGNLTGAVSLRAGYMLPYEIDAPLSWNMNYYDSAPAGYDQQA